MKRVWLGWGAGALTALATSPLIPSGFALHVAWGMGLSAAGTLLGAAYHRKAAKRSTPVVARGQQWVFVGLQKGPWPQESADFSPVTILDVRDGWVRYDMGGRLFRDERMLVSSFVRMHLRVA